jgi:hypothetical protein
MTRTPCLFLFRALFDEVDDPEWVKFVAATFPAECMPTRRGYPWRKLVNQYGVKNMRMLFEHGRNIEHEASYKAEVKFLRWCRRHRVTYRPANYGLRPTPHYSLKRTP